MQYRPVDRDSHSTMTCREMKVERVFAILLALMLSTMLLVLGTPIRLEALHRGMAEASARQMAPGADVLGACHHADASGPLSPPYLKGSPGPSMLHLSSISVTRHAGFVSRHAGPGRVSDHTVSIAHAMYRPMTHDGKPSSAVRYDSETTDHERPDPADATDPSSPPNVVLVVVDALRADHVSAYGYERPTTPNLDALMSDQGALFVNAISASSWTYPSNAAMLTSHTPSAIGVVWADRESSIPQDETMLAEHLHDAGYYTAGFVSAKYAGAEFGFDQGFDVYQEQIGSSGSHTDAEEINEMAMRWISETWTSELSSTQPIFLYLYYFDPHTWYSPPEPYDTLYDHTYTGTLTADVYRDGIIAASGTITPTARDIEHLIALYDGEVTYWDDHLGRMLAYLDDVDLLDHSIVFVTSDHGQMFGEHGKWAHRNSLYEEVLRVPLLIRYSGKISPGTVVTTPVSALDIAPSILDWAGLSVPEDLDGESLRPLLGGEATTGTRAIFSEMDVDALSDPEWFAPEQPLRAIRENDWKYIHHVGAVCRDELYQLQPTSPYEVENLKELEPDTADNLLRELTGWFGLPTTQTYLPYACSVIRGGPLMGLSNRARLCPRVLWR